MIDQEKDKLIVESLGECWHEWEYDSHYNYPKAMLCVCGSKHYKLPILPLATPSGFFWWWKRAQKMEWWDDFIRNFTYHDYLINLVDLTRGRDDLYKFLVERSKGR
jgi:hypothetical protein